jgi:carbamoyltransferase/7-O-carbamoyltransferase
LGPDINNDDARMLIEKNLDLIEFVETNDQVHFLAKEINHGAIIGWARGRMEYGPRALGCRSILADPRPLESKERANRIIKQRESYRPFAPMVLAEELGNWFVVPGCNANFEYMVFNLPVRKNTPKLEAVTHVDNTARVQVVGEYNQDIYDLIKAFQSIAGVPVLLNTSFNVNAEPIVCSAYDAIQCFLLTELDYLVVGPFLIRKKVNGHALYELLRPKKKENVTIIQKQTGEIRSLYINTSAHSERVSATEMSCFDSADGVKTIKELLQTKSDVSNEHGLAYKRLLSKRLLNLVL